MEFVALLTRIQANLTALHSRQSAQVCYFLNVPKPYAEVQMQGNTYRILQDGTTLASVAGLWLPMSGCPYPEAIWKLGTAVFWMRYRRFIPVAVAALVALVSLQFLIATIPGAPGAAWFVDWFAAAMNTALVALAALCLIAATLHNFRRGIVVRFGQPDTAGLLEAGQPDISPDMLILSVSETETGQDFWQRVRDKALDQLAAGQYIVVLQFRCADGVLVREPDIAGQSQVLFDRANLTKDLSGWYNEVTGPRRFDLETWADYCAYVRAFCEQFRVWSQRDKARQGNPIKNMADAAFAGAKAAVLALLLFCSFGVSAQSAVPVPQSAGKSIFQSVPDSAELERLKAEMLAAKMSVGKELRPRQQFLMWTFHNLVVPVIFMVGLLAWFWAMAAFRESEHDAGGNVIFGIGIANGGHYARRVVFICAAIIAGVEILDTMIKAFFENANLWWAAILSVGCTVIWMVIVNWVTPNPRKVDNTASGQGFPTVGAQRMLGK